MTRSLEDDRVYEAADGSKLVLPGAACCSSAMSGI